MSDPKIWFKANAYAGKAIICAGVATIVLSFVLWYLLRNFALSTGQQLVAGLIVELVPLALAVIMSFRQLRHM